MASKEFLESLKEKAYDGTPTKSFIVAFNTARPISKDEEESLYEAVSSYEDASVEFTYEADKNFVLFEIASFWLTLEEVIEAFESLIFKADKFQEIVEGIEVSYYETTEAQ